MKGKLANGVGSQYPSHYLGTWCTQHDPAVGNYGYVSPSVLVTIQLEYS